MSNDERRPGIDQLVSREHRRLDAMFAELQGAMSEGKSAAAGGIFAQLREAMEDHLAREDRLYYPALRALRPDHRRSLHEFATAHDAFRAELAALASAFDGAPMAELQPRIEAIADRFAAHEAGEESLLRRIDAEIEGKGSPLA